ncbi:MAG: hypothetical protein PHQ32_06500 [Firmicutes bacterium]|nr:hypothetical protein [Bacillota bacterium]
MLNQIFTNRELAILIWSLVLVIIVLFNKNSRDSLLNIKLEGALLKIFLFSLVYLVLIILIFSRVHFWDIFYIKDISLVYMFIAIPLGYKIFSENSMNNIKSLIKSNLKLIIMLTLITDSYTFNIFIELILVLITSVIAMMVAFSDPKYIKNQYNDNIRTHKFLSVILSIIGFYILIYSIMNYITDISNYDYLNLIVSFFIPFIISVLYVPFWYLLLIIDYTIRIKKVIKFNIKEIIKILVYYKFNIHNYKNFLHSAYHSIAFYKDKFDINQLLDRYEGGRVL